MNDKNPENLPTLDELVNKDKEEKPAMSPTQNDEGPKQEMMTFSKAMEQVRQGQKVRRSEWEDKKIYASMKDGRLKLHTIKEGQKEYGFHEWVISDGDINGEDYLIVN